MSCISGVGGGVPGLVRKAQSGRQIVATVAAVHHLRFNEQGFKKRRGRRYDEDCREAIIRRLIPVVDALACHNAFLDQPESPDSLAVRH